MRAWLGEERGETGVHHERRADDRALHERLIAGDALATAELAEAYLDPLARWLQLRFPKEDPHLLQDAAIDAVLSLAERPHQYDPGRSSLATYLRMAARRDVLNALRSQRRRQRHQAPVEAVELEQRAGNSLLDVVDDPAESIVRAEPLSAELATLLHETFDGPERQVVQLMLEGERRTAVYAQLLGLDRRPEIEQAREVKRVKDRLQKRLQRLAPKVRRNG
jgi:RNA polymerase sigma-70 factor (ECF subfamily)